MNKFQAIRPEADHPDDAVTVIILRDEGETVADVAFPTYMKQGQLVGPALGNYRPVPVALNQAIDLHRELSILRIVDRIVIQLDSLDLWDEAWGTLDTSSY